MEYRMLGTTDIRVSRLCFGTLVMGPLQKNLSPEAGGILLAEAYHKGINFIDTAELYQTYAHVRESIRISGTKPVISAKSYAYSREGALKSVEKALKEMNVDSLDIFLMHEQESEYTLKGHEEALLCYLDLKRQGIIKAVGVSTHHIACVKAAADMPDIDVIHPLINRSGLGICDGTSEEMLKAIEYASMKRKGIYGMKVFGGGNLLTDFDQCLDFALNIQHLDAIAIGMQNRDELEANMAIFHQGKIIPKEGYVKTDDIKTLNVDFWCEGCGRCAERCQQKAVEVINGKAVPIKERCVLCGYCASVCPVFALKVY
jgi:predicted aldo/keto reductase-like oxidoreductase